VAAVAVLTRPRLLTALMLLAHPKVLALANQTRTLLAAVTNATISHDSPGTARGPSVEHKGPIILGYGEDAPLYRQGEAIVDNLPMIQVRGTRRHTLNSCMHLYYT